MNQSELPGMVFLHLKKAFDFIDATLKKLIISLKTCIHFLNDIAIMQSVLLHGLYSSEGSVTFVVPQGSVLEHILFSTFINDLHLRVNKYIC